MAGENTEVEIGEFPRIRKRIIFERSGRAYIIDADATEPFVPRGSP